MPKFITFEGIEGCGKTTQLHLLAEKLKSAGHPVTITREPGGCPIADRIRGILLDAQNRAMTPLAELLLYAAARAQHVSEIIAPVLARGEILLCDRFTDATLAYQGYGRALDFETIGWLNSLAAGSRKPDLTVLIDCPEEIGLKRAFSRIEGCTGDREERFEQESLQFHRKVRQGYLDLARSEPERFVVVDGAGGIDATAHAVEEAVFSRFAGS